VRTHWAYTRPAVFRRDGKGAAPKCSNQTDLHLTLTDLFHGSDLPERPSPTSMRLVCIQIQKASASWTEREVCSRSSQLSTAPT
jgi:hypothetical protein